MFGRGKWKTALDATAAVALIGASILVGWTTLADRSARRQPANSPQPIPTDPIDLADAAMMGDPKARIGVLEYSDFQCPFCIRFSQQELPGIKRDLIDTGRALWAFRHLPLEVIHPLAFRAAEAAECARLHGKFWAMHDEIFAGGLLGDAALNANASKIGLDEPDFQSCLNGKMTALVRRQQQSAGLVGITGTPAFLLGTLENGRLKVAKVFRGFSTLADFTREIERLEGSLASK